MMLLFPLEAGPSSGNVRGPDRVARDFGLPLRQKGDLNWRGVGEVGLQRLLKPALRRWDDGRFTERKPGGDLGLFGGRVAGIPSKEAAGEGLGTNEDAKELQVSNQ